ncbi:MAG: hypothetical protein HFH93_01730 [Lachnospiraceae bacterium]|nr:hypothetical protein [Lachnospiraceae bacterium]
MKSSEALAEGLRVLRGKEWLAGISELSYNIAVQGLYADPCNNARQAGEMLLFTSLYAETCIMAAK